MSEGVHALPLAAFPQRISELRQANQSVADQLRRNAAALKSDLAARETQKKTRTDIDRLEEQAMRDTVALAAASGTPEQAKAMLRKARGKLMSAAAAGADTAVLEDMVRDFERLTKAAEAKRDVENAAKQKRE